MSKSIFLIDFKKFVTPPQSAVYYNVLHISVLCMYRQIYNHLCSVAVFLYLFTLVFCI